MLNTRISSSHTVHNLPPLQNPFVGGAIADNRSSSSAAYSPTAFRLPNHTKKSNTALTRYIPGNINAISIPSFISSTKTTTVKAVITIQPTITAAIGSINLDVIGSIFYQAIGRAFVLELVSTDLDANGNQKTVSGNASYGLFSSVGSAGLHVYNCDFKVPDDFGNIGAVVVENKLSIGVFFKTIALDNNITFTCDSWVASSSDKRIFFTDKSYLPSDTPNGLKPLRTKDLESLRGDGKGERKLSERIYDYDVYNDLGSPDSSADLARPVLGGSEHPYPRRCRTGRKMTTKDPLSESRTVLPFYVPRDEDFSEIKDISFGARALYTVLHAVVPILDSVLTGPNKGFSLFTDINLLFNEGINVPNSDNGLLSFLPNLIHDVSSAADTIIKFETPETMERDTFSWARDEEFCREMLAGINPYRIELVTEWPLTSKLDPEVYGPAESAITKEIVEEQIGGLMSFEEALEQKKLFLLDYNDLLLPYVNKVRALNNTTLYGSRTLMFLTPAGTLRPLAIELTRPPTDDGKPQWKHVYTPTWEATGDWLWKLAKAQVVSHDSFYHQLVSHWLRTHCATEPYIIATNRHLSQMHPIKRLLTPYFRFTMQINALARLLLINAEGVIESTFGPGKYNVELSSEAYDQQWRFDQEALPANLISRGMAVEDPTAPHGLKLAIEDYPFANDGLLIWDAIKEFATSYVNHYYPQANLIESDEELQAWWTDIRTVGHGDKKDEPWWPQLKTQDDLIQIVSTIMWVPSGHHSAVNFGQYDYAGYFPNRPSTARTKMPNEDPTPEEWDAFIKRPEDALLNCFPSKSQATKVMSVLNILSSHSLDEEYIGGNAEASWAAEPAIKAAFDVFNGRFKELEGIIDSRNANPELRNRNGAGLVPYTLLKPYSGSGVTGKGVPNSISI
ncbi:linoleate 13S-lipoxygenase 2-1, chloroplastic-like [Cynara cardunculus var. scolymus]|uniref:linoleate 13S-lipoxygenase 2-1, chloroplastic-like n=1 Tax=Cynara cardunculus var. scolymus TaxID=59895 RepID=UPI000D63028A|nr:linoleate 13S-lipoxygenase 2-1, chloroplastic-like [Cynara cardunculus var. scolymus]